jgi:hypothetical protein
MARVVLSFAADADAAGIIAYLTSKAGHATAAKYNALFENLYDRLAVHHEPAADLITVLRIVDGRRRITGKLLVG